MAEQKGLPSDDLKSISDRIIQLSQADHCRVNIDSGWRGYTRVATNRITSAGGADSTNVNITSVFGKRVASINTNSLDSSELEAAVRQSEIMARLAPESPEYVPELGVQSYQPVQAYYDSTGELDPLTRAEAAAIAIQQAQASDQIAASYINSCYIQWLVWESFQYRCCLHINLAHCRRSSVRLGRRRGK